MEGPDITYEDLKEDGYDEDQAREIEAFEKGSKRFFEELQKEEI